MSPLEILILLPLLAALAIWAGAPARITSITAAASVLLLSFGLIYHFGSSSAAHGGLAFQSARVIFENPAISFSVAADGVSLTMALLTGLVLLAAVWQIADTKPSIYHIASHLIAAGALGAFLSNDLFFIYSFHELALIPTFLMIALHGHADAERRRAVAWKTTLYLGIGSLVLLVGLAWLVAEYAGGQKMTFDLQALKSLAASAPLPLAKQGLIFAVLLVGFGSLVSLFPFHSWAAPAYATAPTPIAMLHAGVLKKFGLYGLIKVAMPLLPQAMQIPWLQQLLFWMLLGNILVIGFVTIHQRSLDLVLGYSSVMHMGYIFLGIAAATELSLQGAVLLMFAHGIAIALLFSLAGRIRIQLGTLELDKLGGLASQAPLFTVLFAFGAFASLGLPGLANFSGELLIFIGAFGGSGSTEIGPAQLTVILALWGVVMSAVYMLRAYRKAFHGVPASGLFMNDLPKGQGVPLILLAAALLIIGCCPWLLLNLYKSLVTVQTAMN